MKITKKRLQQIIREELAKAKRLLEAGGTLPSQDPSMSRVLSRLGTGDHIAPEGAPGRQLAQQVEQLAQAEPRFLERLRQLMSVFQTEEPATEERPEVLDPGLTTEQLKKLISKIGKL